MKLNTYKNYRTCPICNKTLPFSRKFFKRVNRKGQESLHLICRECENKIALEKEWKDGELLCHYCGEYKPIECFSSKGSKSSIRNNRRTICNEGNSKRQKYHDLSLSEDKKLDKCLRFRFLGARDRALKQNIEFNITFDYVKELWNKQKGICALSGIPMTYALKEGRTPTNISIDKIDRAKGYTIGNVQLVCMACNQIKSDLTEEEMYNFCKRIVGYYENKNNKNTESI